MKTRTTTEADAAVIAGLVAALTGPLFGVGIGCLTSFNSGVAAAVAFAGAAYGVLKGLWMIQLTGREE